MEWSKKKYNATYDSWVPWLEDKYLAYFGENKASYMAKDQLKGTKITGDKNIGAVQDGLAEGVGGQLSSGGLLGGVGDMTSKEGVNRAERGDTGPIPKQDLDKQQKTWGQSLTGGYLGSSKK